MSSRVSAVGLSMLCVLSMLSCGTVERQRLKRELYPTWPASIQQAVDKEIVVPGMNEMQVYLATGVSPSLIRKQTTVTESGVSQTWILYKSFGGWTFADPASGTMFQGATTTVLIHFRDGIVQAVSSY